MSTPKRQHYIPILHLKHFVGDNPAGHIWTYDKSTGANRHSTPDNTAVETHFYSAEKDDGSLDTTLETFLSEIEGKAAATYENLLEGRFPTSDQERADFATFLALMYARTPSIRRDAAEMYARQVQIMNFAYGTNDKAFETLVKKLEKEENIVFDESKKAMLKSVLLDPSQFKIIVRKEATFSALGIADRIAPIFFKMNWGVAQPDHSYFITSDNPIVRWVDPKSRHPVLGDHGFMNKTMEISFPLSPKRILLMAWQKIPEEGRYERDSVWYVNDMRAAYAENFLYSHVQNKRISDIAKKHKNSRPRMITSGFGPKRFSPVEVARRWDKPKQ